MAEPPEGKGVATTVAGRERVPVSVSAVATAMVPMSQHGTKIIGSSGGPVSTNGGSS